MVRVNLINPRFLTDQHLVAEYAEILMLAAYIKAHPDKENIPGGYVLGQGHMRFFKDKLLYLKKRHELIKKEMKTRGFAPCKGLNVKGLDKSLMNDWKPKPEEMQLIKKRIIQKLKLKPEWYRYYKKHRTKKFLIGMVLRAD